MMNIKVTSSINNCCTCLTKKLLYLLPPSQLCYLHADIVKNLNARDTKKQFPEFYNNFLEKGAVSKTTFFLQKKKKN